MHEIGRAELDSLSNEAGHGGHVHSVAWTSDGRRIATGCADGIVRVWQSDGNLDFEIPVGDYVRAVAWDPSNRWLAIGGKSVEIYIWDTADLRKDPTPLIGHEHQVNSLAWHTNGRTLASGSDDDTAIIWKDVFRSPLKRSWLRGHTDHVRSLAWSPFERNLLATGSHDGTVRVWHESPVSGTWEDVPLGAREHWGKGINAVAWAPDGQSVASGDYENLVRLWATDEPTKEPIVLTTHADWVSSLAWSPDGETLASVSADQTINYWQAGASHRDVIHDDWIACVAWCAASDEIATCGHDHTARIRTPRSKEAREVLPRRRHSVTCLAATTRREVTAIGSTDGAVRIYQARRRKPRVLRSGQGMAAITSLALSVDGRLLAAGDADARIAVWSLESAESGSPPDHVLEDHDRFVSALAWNPQEPRLLASGSRDGTVRLWAIPEDGSKPSPTPVDGHSDWVEAIGWSADGQILATGSADQFVRLWRSPQRAPDQLPTMPFRHRDWVRALAWSPVENVLATGSTDNTVTLFDADASQVLTRLAGHRGAVRQLAWSQEGSLLASASSDDHTVRVWRRSVMDCVWTSPHDRSGFPVFESDADGRPVALISIAEVGELQVRASDSVDAEELLARPVDADTRFYRSARIALVGESGAGKSGLALVLSGKPWRPTESTHGRHVYRLEAGAWQQWISTDEKEVRDPMIWDLAGQPLYRTVHQLHLDDVSVALYVVDAERLEETLAQVGYWVRTIEQARSRKTAGIRQILVGARMDCVKTAARRDETRGALRSACAELGLDAWVATSARGYRDGSDNGMTRLSREVIQSIHWDDVPHLTSSSSFEAVRRHLVNLVEKNQHYASLEDITGAVYGSGASEPDMQTVKTAIGLAEDTGLVRRIDTERGWRVLLQPEVLDGYASSILSASLVSKGELDYASVVRGDYLDESDYRADDPLEQEELLRLVVRDLENHYLAVHQSDGRVVFPGALAFDAGTRQRTCPPNQRTWALPIHGPARNALSCAYVWLRRGAAARWGMDEELRVRGGVEFLGQGGSLIGVTIESVTSEEGALLAYARGLTDAEESRFVESLRAFLEEQVTNGERVFVTMRDPRPRGAGNLADSGESGEKVQAEPRKGASPTAVTAAPQAEPPATVGVVVALEEEFRVIRKALSRRKVKFHVIHDRTQLPSYSADYVSPAGHPCVFQFYVASEMGPGAAGDEAARMVLLDPSPDVVLSVGLAGGLSDDVRLTDVVVASGVNNYMENTKASGRQRFILEHAGAHVDTDPVLLKHAAQLEFHSEREFRRLCSKRKRLLSGMDQAVLSGLVKAGLLSDTFRAIGGPIASGPTVGTSKAFAQWLKTNNRKYIALEEEAGAVGRSIRNLSGDRKLRFLVVRGISDPSDARKGLIDHGSKGAIRRIAMTMAWDHALATLDYVLAQGFLGHANGPQDSLEGQEQSF